jgi:hypothetical protein
MDEGVLAKRRQDMLAHHRRVSISCLWTDGEPGLEPSFGKHLEGCSRDLGIHPTPFHLRSLNRDEKSLGIDLSLEGLAAFTLRGITVTNAPPAALSAPIFDVGH